jgi:PPK2 family polyphosphate:nucleotide phosphotransferase
MSPVIKLSDFPTQAPEGLTKKKIKKETDKITRRIADLQHIMYAEEKNSLLLVIQGMDASGKDGSTRKVFRYCSPTGINAYAFKKPTEEEFDHDFLWRIHKLAPRKGKIQIFNRSHYEDILIQRVHNWIDEDKVNARIDAINAFERNIMLDNNTTILKFYMHISEDKQKLKLQERINNPRKNWKHNSNDWKERKHWSEYMRCYEDAINRCNVAPWHIAPVDQRWYRDYFIAQKVLETLEGFNMQLPVLSEEDKIIPA